MQYDQLSPKLRDLIMSRLHLTSSSLNLLITSELSIAEDEESLVESVKSLMESLMQEAFWWGYNVQAASEGKELLPDVMDSIVTIELQ